MSSSASGATNKHEKLDVSSFQPQLQSSNVSVSPSLILSAIGHIFEAIDMVDKFDFGHANPAKQLASKSNVRTKLYSALDALRTMAPDSVGMHINQLPDDCLNLIFNKRFSLKSMMATLRPVCRRWNTVLECTFSTQRSLKLIGEPKCTYAYQKYANELIRYNLIRDEELILQRTDRQHHVLILPTSWAHKFDPLFFNSLGGLFRNLQHLVLCVQTDSLFGHQKELGQIIAQWPHLTRLTLFIERCNDSDDSDDSDESDSDIDSAEIFDEEWPDTFALYQAINSLSSLKHLDLFGDLMLYCKDMAAELDKVLPQLEHLSFIYRFMDFNLDTCLEKLSSNFKSLRLFQFEISDDTLRGNFQRLASNITELRLTDVSKKIFNFICEHFCLLKTLEMDFDGDLNALALDSNFISNLNRLSYLESLSLANIDLDSTQVIPSSPVKSLQLANIGVKSAETDSVLFVKTLKQMFPHLEELYYQYGISFLSSPFLTLSNYESENYLRAQFAHLTKSRFTYRYYVCDFYDFE